MSNAETKTKPFKGAQVLWPPDIPDDILEDAVSVPTYFRFL